VSGSDPLAQPDLLPPAPFRASMAAVSRDWIIAVDDRLPWRYPEDVRRLWRLTKGAALVFGRRTWESLPRPPRGCRNLVLSRTTARFRGAERFADLETALAAASEAAVWFLGGTEVYQAAMPWAKSLSTCSVTFPQSSQISNTGVSAWRGPRQAVQAFRDSIR